MSDFYVCEECKRSGVDFRVPADPIGVALMKGHLADHARARHSAVQEAQP